MGPGQAKVKAKEMEDHKAKEERDKEKDKDKQQVVPMAMEQAAGGGTASTAGCFDIATFSQKFVADMVAAKDKQDKEKAEANEAGTEEKDKDEEGEGARQAKLAEQLAEGVRSGVAAHSAAMADAHRKELEEAKAKHTDFSTFRPSSDPSAFFHSPYPPGQRG